MSEPSTEPLCPSSRAASSTALLVIVVAVVVFAWSYWLSSATRVSTTTQRAEVSIELARDCSDFGEVWETSNYSWQLRFANPNREHIRIERLVSSCDCVELPSQALEIPPGGERTVDIRLDLTKQKPTLRDGRYWHVRFPLIVHWTDGVGKERQAGWYLTGKVKDLVEVRPSTVWIGDNSTRGHRGITKTVVVKPLLDGLDLQLSRWPANLECFVTAEGDGYKLSITPTAQLPAGYFSGEVHFLLWDAARRPLPSQKILVYGTVNERVVVAPDIINLGVVKVGNSVDETLKVSSRTGEPFEVTKLSGLANTAIVSRQRTSDSESIRLRHSVGKAGRGSVHGHVEVRLSSGERLELPFQLHWYGSEEAVTETAR